MIFINHKFIKYIPRESFQDMVLTKKVTNHRFELKSFTKLNHFLDMVWKEIIIKHSKVWFIRGIS